MLDTDDIRLLEKKQIKKGERWLYSADFNTKYSKKEDGSVQLKSTERIDGECKDIKYISEKGGIVIILAHQGRFKDKDTVHLDFITPYLSKKLGKEVKYFPENNTPLAVEFVKSLEPGDVAIMGNTRFHEGEEKNDSLLAQQFANLISETGGCIAISGFGKAHRAHASNVGILQHLAGYATKGHVREMNLLKKWAGRKKEVYSVAVLGGVKKEKITEGLKGFSETYDIIIPGGIVLNTIYLAQGRKIGKSVIEDEGKKYDNIIKEILKADKGKKICIPKEVIIAKPTNKGFEDVKKIMIDQGVPEDYMIVDFVLPDSALRTLENLSQHGGRLVLAGTPGIYTAGFKTATDTILEYTNKNDIDVIALGGDTSSEIKLKGYSSTGGGSALSFVANGTTAVYEALKLNKKKFSEK